MSADTSPAEYVAEFIDGPLEGDFEHRVLVVHLVGAIHIRGDVLPVHPNQVELSRPIGHPRPRVWSARRRRRRRPGRDTAQRHSRRRLPITSAQEKRRADLSLAQARNPTATRVWDPVIGAQSWSGSTQT